MSEMSEPLRAPAMDPFGGWMHEKEIENKLAEVDALLGYCEMEADDISSEMVALLRCARRLVRDIRQARRLS